MAPRERTSVSTYLQTFILIAVAVGGSVLVYATTSKYSASAQGPAILVSNPSIRQGPLQAWGNNAVERLTLSNVGTGSFASFTLSTPGISGSYCFSIQNAVSGAVILAASPPCNLANPSSVTASATVSPGGSVTIELTIVSTSSTVPVFASGTGYTVVVSTSNAAQASLKVVALPT